MKNILSLIFALIFGALNLSATVSSDALNFTNCTWHSYFEYPNKTHFYAGEDVYVKVKAQKYQDIMFMELYCGNQYIRKESSTPYEWCQPNGSGDSYLRNLSPGNYKLKCKIKDKCGYTNYCYYDIVVTGNGGGGGGNHNTCSYSNPLMDLHWLKTLKQQHPNWKICEYKKNGKKYFQLYQCGITHYEIQWYDCEGNFICEHQNGHNPCGTVSGAQYIKCWYNPCGNNGGGGGQSHCTWDSWFTHPQNNSHFDSGEDVYCKVQPQKYQDIEFMELYVNGQYCRKETMYPYEWCKGGGNSDHKLRDLSPGTYNLKVKIKDKCGNYYEKNCTFYVDPH